jgi:LPS sulfotransferase NodH
MRLPKKIKAARRTLQHSTVYLRLLKPRELAGRFVIFGQGRTGSTLLVQLLNSSPDIYCEEEILSRKVLSPYAYVKARSHRSPRPFYGFKVKIYQLTHDQGIARPREFIERMVNDDWKIIYLKRADIVRHAMSNVVAAHRRAYHHRASQGELKLQKFHVDSDDFIRRIKLRERWLKDEEEVLEGLPHLSIQYETDLLHPEVHQATTDRVLDFLGATRAPAKTELVRTSRDRLADVIENYDEVIQAIARTRYAPYLRESNYQSH